jgi:hypothetical protein
MFFSYVPIYGLITTAGISTYHATKYFLFLMCQFIAELLLQAFPHIMQKIFSFSYAFFYFSEARILSILNTRY